jgi:glycosyltransferase involved in cell wall biosynthesis
MLKSKFIAICIPAFNEENNIEEVISKAKGLGTEVIVCDDGSQDKTYELAFKTGVTVIKHAQNRGYGRTLNTLFEYALNTKADVIVTLDSDGQHNPEQISRLLEPINSNSADIVIGSRFISQEGRTNVPIYRSLGIKAITRITQLACYEKITDATSGFRAYSYDALSKLRLLEDGMAISTEILLKAKQLKLKIMEVPITTCNYELKDKSTQHPVRMGMEIMMPIIKHMAFQRPRQYYQSVYKRTRFYS